MRTKFSFKHGVTRKYAARSAGLIRDQRVDCLFTVYMFFALTHYMRKTNPIVVQSWYELGDYMWWALFEAKAAKLTVLVPILKTVYTICKKLRQIDLIHR